MERILAGHYQIVRHLGGGGFGQTFLAQDNHLPGRPLCVVKQLKLNAQGQASLEIAKRLFDREAETLYRLGNHDQIPRLLAHFEQDQEFYLVQDYVAGQTLDREIHPGEQLSEAAVIDLLQDILQVLSFVHQQQVIHRDIKPSNLIRRAKDNRIVLIDFGAVKEVGYHSEMGSGETSLTVAIGSPGYMPSEQRAFQPRFSSDLYAVGVLAMQALSGLHPKFLPVNSTTGELSCAGFRNRAPIQPGLAAILDKMVRYDYRQRYETATEALRALHQFLGKAPALPIEPASSAAPTALETPPEEPTVLAAPVSINSNSSGSSQIQLALEVKQQLEQLLTEWIGPIAPVFLKAALARSIDLPNLIERLTIAVPEPKRSQVQKQLIAILQPSSSALPANPSGATTVPIAPEPPSAATRPEFIKRCELELATVVGPIAPLLVQRTLARQPHLSAAELVESLIQHLRDPKAVEAFRRSLLALL